MNEEFFEACRRHGIPDTDAGLLAAAATTASFAAIRHLKETIAALTADMTPLHRSMCIGLVMIKLADGVLEIAAEVEKGMADGA